MEILKFITEKLPGKAMLLTKDVNVMKDLVQDTCLKMLVHRDKYEHLPPPAQRAIANTIMTNTFIDYTRRRKKHPQIDSDDYPDVADDALDVDSLDVIKRFHDMVAKDKSPVIQSLYLYTEGMSVKEISEHFQTGINTTSGRILRARRTIVNQLR